MYRRALLHVTAFRQALDRLARSTYSRDVLTTLVTRGVSFAFAITASALVARLLGVEGRGAIAVASTLSGLAIQFGNFGLHSANSYYAARDRALLAPLFANSLLASLVLGTVASLVLGALVLLRPSFAPLSMPLLVVALASVPLSLASMFGQNLLLGIGKVRAYNLVELLSGGAAFVALVLAFVLALAHPEVVFLAGLAGPAAALAAASLVLARSTDTPLRPSLAVFRDTLRYGFKAYLSCVFAFLVLRVDLLMVQYFAGMEQASYYATAASLGNILYVVPSVAATIAFPRMAALQDAGERWRFTRRLSFWTGVSMLPACAVAMLLAPSLVRLLYTDAFLPAVAPFRILAVGMIFYGVNSIVSSHLAALDFPWFAVHVWIVATVVNVGLNVLWIPGYGPVGAAFASVVAYAFVLVVQFAYSVGMARRHASHS